MTAEAGAVAAPTPLQPRLVIEFVEEATWLGGVVYIDNLLATLSALPEPWPLDVRLTFLSSPSTPAAQRLLRHRVVNRRAGAASMNVLAIVLRRAAFAAIRRMPWLGRALTRRDGEVHFPAFNTSRSWRRNLYWIPDFQHHYLPELFEPAERAWRDSSYAQIAQANGLLVLSSQSALDDFRRFYPQARVRPRVWSFCSSVESAAGSTCDEVRRRHALPPHFVYVANQFWRHKDHRVVIEALHLLRQRGIEVQVVCTGVQEDRRDPSHVPALLRLMDQYGIAGQFHLLGVVPRDEQLQLFRLAAAVLQPSRFEGWSTVIEDAKAFGRPVIASDLAVHREQLAHAPHACLFGVSDAEDLARCLEQALQLPPGPDPAAEAVAAGVTQHRRQQAAHEFVAIVREALGDNTNNRTEQ
jgi:glycosyltransferase involved in cell wall biosynthesis